MASTSENQPTQAVRFSDVNEEIKPDKALQHVSDLTDCGEHSKEPLSPEAEEEIRNLSMTLQKSRCQARRMEKFSFEPVSLPTSRVSTRLMVYQLATDLFCRLRLQLQRRAHLRDTHPSAQEQVHVLLLLPPRCTLLR